GGKSLAAIGIGTGSTVFAPTTQKTPGHARGVSDLDPISSRKAVFTEDPDSEKSASFTFMVVSPGSIYQPGWGVTNNCRLDTPACAPGHSGPHSTTREAKLLKKSVAQIARRDQRIQARGKHIKILNALLEAEADMKDTTEAKNVELVRELEASTPSSLIIKLATINYPSKCLLSRLKSQVKKGSKMLLKSLRNTRMTGYILRLAIMKCTESLEVRQVFADVVSAGIAK
nr:hypothetical protein [Tanacetum cinerariifolium]